MTALATALALSSGQPGSEIQAPMAIVILFGLLSSTLLNMIVLPALSLRFGALPREARRSQKEQALEACSKPDSKLGNLTLLSRIQLAAS